ncbi:hypothetical protein CXB51_003283 [Gossypium anomalum]|uniref:Uncharacterized protein n=1 Tax=Gossypium anomalum TaxID=47600 RepID=A0A8J5Z5U6_9ROSI|nr:hypothetical protein CXB51_003283 [Gossypium anomalum]
MLLTDLYELNSIEHVKVARNSLVQPIGSKARLLAGYLGIIAQNANLLPINYESWHHTSDSNKNQALDNIKERFALEVSDNYVKKALGKKWRDHKSALKKEYFKKNISLKEKLRNVPPGMLKYQWEDTVRYGIQRKERIVSELELQVGKNKNSCTQLGTATGQKVGRLQLFEVTHRKKDGSPMTTEVAKIMRLRDQMAQMQASIIEQIAQLKTKATSREVEAQRKYEELRYNLKRRQ